MLRSRAASNHPDTFFVAQFSAGYITNMPGFDLRQAHRKVPNPDNAVLFNHLIGTSDDRRRNDEGECLALRLNDD